MRPPPGHRASGCPPELRATPRIRYQPASRAASAITSLAIDDVPKGARAEVRGGGGASHQAGAARRRPSRWQLVGRTVARARKIEIRVTLGRTGKGRFRFGATGKYYRWPVTSTGLGNRVQRCLNPGSRKPIKCR